jgi:ketosteroid isomerase-like protein
MDIGEQAGQFFALFESQQFDGIAALCSPDVRIKQNANPEHDLDGLMAFVGGLKNEGVTVDYSDVRRSVGNDFVVEQHVVTLTRPDGKSASTDVCHVLRFADDGRIVRMDEYSDSAAFATLYT